MENSLVTYGFDAYTVTYDEAVTEIRTILRRLQRLEHIQSDIRIEFDPDTLQSLIHEFSGLERRLTDPNSDFWKSA